MNRNSSSRSLRTVLSGWLRALIRRNPFGSGAERPPDEDRQDAGGRDAVRMTPAQEGAVQPEAGETFQSEMGEGGGPPEHWLALTRSKGPPQHWLDLIRSRLGDDFSRIPWIRVRALQPPQPQPAAAPRTLPSTPAGENQAEAPLAESAETLTASEEPGEPLSQENEPVLPQGEESRPAPLADRRPPTALRLYPAPAADQKEQAVQPRPVPQAASQPPAQAPRRLESTPQPAPQAAPRPASTADARPPDRPPEPPKPHAVPLMPVPQARTQTPVPPAPVKAPEVRPAQTEPEPAPTAPGAQRAPRADHWPMWQEPVFTTPFPAPEPPAAARQESLRPEPPAPLRTERARPLPPQQAWPAVNPPLSAPDPWPDLPEPIRVRRRDRRELPTGPTPADRWPALDRPEDDDLAADEWESYQRDWQRLVRLRREQQGQLWTEWPF